MYRYLWSVVPVSNSHFWGFAVAQPLLPNDKLRRFVFVVMRWILSTTSRFLVLMLLDLCFAGLPSFPPLAKISILRVGAEGALLLTGNFWCL